MNDVIDSVSYDQFKNIPTADEMGIDTKIILSSESYFKLLQMIKHTKNIDYFTSDFKCEDALIQGGSASPTQQVYNELNSELEKYNQLGKKHVYFIFILIQECCILKAFQTKIYQYMQKWHMIIVALIVLEC